MYLIGSPASPFVQRCLIVARAKGHDLSIAPVPGGSVQSEDFRAISPMARFPLLCLESGETICESSAIIAYLNESLTGPPLLPATPLDRARVREIEAIAIGEVAAGMRPIMVHRVFRMGDNDPLVEAAVAQIDLGCTALARLMAERDHLSETLTFADAALLPFITLMRIVSFVPEVAGLMAKHDFLATYADTRAAGHEIAAHSVTQMTSEFAAILARIGAANQN